MTWVAGIHAGLVGRGIGGSASPAIHEREAGALGLELHYELFDFDELDLDDGDLADCLDDLAHKGFAGVNITHPFKQAVIPLLDRIDSTAELLGSVNCVTFSNGVKQGFNSDMLGFGFLLEHELSHAPLDCVAQIGAGGAGSATAFALLSAGVPVLRIYDALPARAHNLMARLAASFPEARISVAANPQDAFKGATGIVQTTPIGMDAHPGTPFDPDLVEPRQWLADIIYFPRQTELVRTLRARGVRAVGGAAMAVGQASEPFRLFTGYMPDRKRMLATFLAADKASGGQEASVR